LAAMRLFRITELRHQAEVRKIRNDSLLKSVSVTINGEPYKFSTLLEDKGRASFTFQKCMLQDNFSKMADQCIAESIEFLETKESPKDTMASFIEKKESLTIEPAPAPSKKKMKLSASNYLKQNPNPSNPNQLKKKDASTCTADLVNCLKEIKYGTRSMSLEDPLKENLENDQSFVYLNGGCLLKVQEKKGKRAASEEKPSKNPKKKRKKSKQHAWKKEELESKLEVQNIIDAKEAVKMRSQILNNKSEFVSLERKRQAEDEITKKKRLEERRNEYERSQRNIVLSQTPISQSPNVLTPPVVSTATPVTLQNSFSSKIIRPDHSMPFNLPTSSSQNIIQNHKFNQFMPQTPVPPEQIFGKRSGSKYTPNSMSSGCSNKKWPEASTSNIISRPTIKQVRDHCYIPSKSNQPVRQVFNTSTHQQVESSRTQQTSYGVSSADSFLMHSVSSSNSLQNEVSYNIARQPKSGEIPLKLSYDPHNTTMPRHYSVKQNGTSNPPPQEEGYVTLVKAPCFSAVPENKKLTSTASVSTIFSSSSSPPICYTREIDPKKVPSQPVSGAPTTIGNSKKDMEAVDLLVSLRNSNSQYNKADETQPKQQRVYKPASEQPLPPSATKSSNSRVTLPNQQPANPAKYVSHSPAVVHHVATTQVSKAQALSHSQEEAKKKAVTTPQVTQPQSVTAVVNSNQKSSIIKLTQNFTNPKVLLPGGVTQPANVLNLSKSTIPKQNEVKIFMMNKEGTMEFKTIPINNAGAASKKPPKIMKILKPGRVPPTITTLNTNNSNHKIQAATIKTEQTAVQQAKTKIVMPTAVQIMTTSPKTSQPPLTPIAHLNFNRSKSAVTTGNHQQGGSAPIIRTPVALQKSIGEHVVEIIKTSEVIDT